MEPIETTTSGKSIETAIYVSNLTKVYPLYNSPGDRLKEALHPFRKKYHHDFYALKDVNFEITKGETIGIIGQNGSGKSTLLKILSRVLTPTNGKCIVNGKVSSLLELGTGFNPELTGIENVYFNGTILGFTKAEMDSKLEDILSFADIGEFVKQPVKMYSSGMYVRLAFAVAVQVNPDILIVDEALAVGDARFQNKSMNKMLQFVESGKTVIFVSHDTTAVKTLCKRAILLDKGVMLKDSYAPTVVDYYNNMVINDMHKGENDLLHPAIQTPNTEKLVSKYEMENDKPIVFAENSIISSDIELLAIHMYDSKKHRIESITSEEDLTIVFKIRSNIDVIDPHYGIRFNNRLGVSAFETNTYCMGLQNETLNKGDIAIVEFSLNCNLIPDMYALTIGFANKGYDRGSFEYYHFLLKDVALIRVVENSRSIIYGGYYNMKPKVVINRIEDI
jgi:lipopolysaccharide transport system ATP-binding protein